MKFPFGSDLCVKRTQESQPKSSRPSSPVHPPRDDNKDTVTSLPECAQTTIGLTLRVRDVQWPELGGVGEGSLMLEHFADGQYLPPHPPGSRAERGHLRLGEKGSGCPDHYPHLPPGGPGRCRGRRAWGGGCRAPCGGAVRRQRARPERGPRAEGRAAPQVRAAVGRGRAARGGTFLAGKGAIVCCYSWYVRPARGPGRGRRPAGGGGKDADEGARPCGAQLRSRRAARERERGPGPASGGPRHPLAQTV